MASCVCGLRVADTRAHEHGFAPKEIPRSPLPFPPFLHRPLALHVLLFRGVRVCVCAFYAPRLIFHTFAVFVCLLLPSRNLWVAWM